jgi:hypothetical protein
MRCLSAFKLAKPANTAVRPKEQDEDAENNTRREATDQEHREND